MKRVLCLWLPNWPIQRQWLKQPELRRRPLVLFATAQRDQEIVAACCPLAIRHGIRVGMPLAEAKATGNDRDALCIMVHDPLADRATLQRLAWACNRFAPIVGIETSAGPECLLLDVTGCGPVFRGEENLACQLYQDVQRWGLKARIAIAGTVGLAWAAAHVTVDSKPITTLSSEDEHDTLRILPIEALRLSASVTLKLRQLGIRRVEHLLDLPRQSLPSRFGTEIIERLDQMLGDLPEPITPERRPEPLDAVWETETPLCDENRISVILTKLLSRILDKLHRNR